MQFFVAKVDFNLENLAILRDEVAEVKLVNFDEFQKIIKESPDDFMDSPEFCARNSRKSKENHTKISYSQAIL